MINLNFERIYSNLNINKQKIMNFLPDTWSANYLPSAIPSNYQIIEELV